MAILALPPDDGTETLTLPSLPTQHQAMAKPVLRHK